MRHVQVSSMCKEYSQRVKVKFVVKYISLTCRLQREKKMFSSTGIIHWAVVIVTKIRMFVVA